MNYYYSHSWLSSSINVLSWILTRFILNIAIEGDSLKSLFIHFFQPILSRTIFSIAHERVSIDCISLSTLHVTNCSPSISDLFQKRNWMSDLIQAAQKHYFLALLNLYGFEVILLETYLFDCLKNKRENWWILKFHIHPFFRNINL